jgi:hypothetical protein
LILLLDIDNTLLHASQPNISEKEYLYLKKKFDYQFTTFKIRNERYYVKLRPLLKDLFKYIFLILERLKIIT